MSELLTPKELAAREGVHPITVYRWTSIPKFPLKRVGSRGRILIDVEQFLLFKSKGTL